MKNKNGIYIIGVDHGYGNIKTANCCFPTGVESSDTEPTFKNDLLIYQGRYYQIGVSIYGRLRLSCSVTSRELVCRKFPSSPACWAPLWGDPQSPL